MDAAVISAIISFAFGTVLGTYLKIRWERANSAQLQKQEYKTTRYKAVLILMYCYLDFDSENPRLRAQGRHFTNVDELGEELIIEWNNMLLYASDAVLITAHDFISNPTKQRFQSCVLAMRRDLWGGKVSLKMEDIVL